MGSLQKTAPLEVFPLPRETWDLCLLFLEDSRTPNKLAPCSGITQEIWQEGKKKKKKQGTFQKNKTKKGKKFLVLQRVHSVRKSQVVIPVPRTSKSGKSTGFGFFPGILDWGRNLIGMGLELDFFPSSRNVWDLGKHRDWGKAGRGGTIRLPGLGAFPRVYPFGFSKGKRSNALLL